MPLFVPGTLTLIDLLRTLRQQKTAFALVVSEFGVTEGSSPWMMSCSRWWVT
ncbi:MAG: hypothetical protein ACYCZJ_07715 [Sulfuriferula sp.]